MEIQARLPDSKIKNASKNLLFVEPKPSFYLGIDRNKFWFPEELSPWYYLASYSDLSPEVRRRYNQLYALGTNEVFAVFEVDFVCRIFKKIAKNKSLNQELKNAMARIDIEEEKHARVFHQLNKAAAPEYFTDANRGRFFSKRADGFGVFLLNVVARFPSLFGVWVWIALIFEERSILYSKHYQNTDDSIVDSKFKHIHHLHLIEEVSHVKLDEDLVGEFYLKLSWWKRRMTRFFLERVLNSFRSPKRMSRAIADVLKTEFPSAKAQINQCLSELPNLRLNDSFQNLLFGPSAFKRTQRLLETCSELQDL